MSFESWIVRQRILQSVFGKDKVVFSLPNNFISFLGNKLGSKLYYSVQAFRKQVRLRDEKIGERRRRSKNVQDRQSLDC